MFGAGSRTSSARRHPTSEATACPHFCAGAVLQLEVGLTGTCRSWQPLHPALATCNVRRTGPKTPSAVASRSRSPGRASGRLRHRCRAPWASCPPEPVPAGASGPPPCGSDRRSAPGCRARLPRWTSQAQMPQRRIGRPLSAEPRSSGAGSAWARRSGQRPGPHQRGHAPLPPTPGTRWQAARGVPRRGSMGSSRAVRPPAERRPRDSSPIW